MTKDYEKQKQTRLTPSKHYINAVTYLGGVYLLKSIMCLWWELADKHLKMAGGTSFDFKFEYNAVIKQMNRFELALRKYIDRKEETCSSFEIINGRLEKMLDETKEKMNDYLNELIKKDLQHEN